jgi:hypothetical protein
VRITAKFDDTKFINDMNSIIEYSFGFIDGAKKATPVFLQNLGSLIQQKMGEYVDVMARLEPQKLKHVYEFGMNGTESGRLFDINYRVSGNGLSVNSSFRQSSVAGESGQIFYNKAKIMEEGIPVTIKPKRKVLAFNDNGEMVFTQKPVTVKDPGGPQAQNGYETTIRSFIESYFSQSFLHATGLDKHLSEPTYYKSGLSSAKVGGRAAGERQGYEWLAKAGVSL